MVSEQGNFEWCADFEDSSYKSCFARSVAVNSQYKQSKTSSDMQQLQPEVKSSQESRSSSRPLPPIPIGVEPIVQGVKLRKISRASSGDDPRRLSCSSIGSSRTSICSSRLSEIPVENMVHQSKVATLQWQLREVEKSREMYKALVKQVVTFLERAHRNLELLGTKLNTKSTVPRSKSEHQIVTGADAMEPLCNGEDYTAFRDFTWRRPKKQEMSPEEIPPEKLSQEAFRLLRTAQSLLSTQEPKLAQQDDPDDIEFIAQLAKEFPRTPEAKPQRTTSFSLSPKLLTPERENRIATAFNRKLSLQLNETRKPSYKFKTSSTRNSVVDCESALLPSSVEEFVKEQRINFPNEKASFIKRDSEKSSSPPAGSISSVEDESGFSSMNSFQDVGVPVVGDEVTTKNALLRSMLQNNVEKVEPVHGYVKMGDLFNKSGNVDDVKLWQKADLSHNHKRWSSTPVNDFPSNNKKPANVLWV